MEMRRAGNSGLTLSRLGLGTMTWGRDTDEHEAADQCRAYIEAGGNFIDTANTYGDGDSERVIGGLIGTLFNRDDVVIATKSGLSFPDGIRNVDASRQSLISELDKSLTRLAALDYAYTTGRARYVGVSNFAGWQLSRAATKQESNSMKAPITTIQAEYSLLNRDVEIELLECAAHCGVGFLAWAPLARGVLTGKYRSGLPSDSRGAAPHFAKHIEPYLDSHSSRTVDAVSVAASGLGYSPLEVALAWVRDAPGVTSAIIGARTGAQLRGALKSEEITLPEILRSALNDVSA